MNTTIEITRSYEWLTVKDTAEYLHTSTKFIYELIHSGKLPFGRVGCRYRIKAVDVMDYVLNA